MDLSRVNLNLLVTLNTLLQEANVTRASQKLFLSQAALSNSLNQLRSLFNNELLVRSGKKMVLTPKAIQLKSEIKLIVENLKEFITHQQQFDPLTSNRIFIIGISDYSEFILMPLLVENILKKAPHITLLVKHNNLFGSKDFFEQEDVDIALGMVRKKSPEIQCEQLYIEKFVCVGDKKNPLLQKPLTLKNYLNARHVTFMSERSAVYCILKEVLGKKGFKEENPAVVMHTIPGLYCLRGTSLVATTLTKIADHLCRPLQLIFQPVPLNIPPEPICLLWHKKNAQDPGHIWLREIIKNIAIQ